jgi:dephospho-CoA kinase
MGEHNGSSPRHRPLVVGVTGAAGSGKSTVTAMLAALGAQTADADALVRWAYADSALRAALAERFGSNVIAEDGSVARARLADIVFSDGEARADLEAMVHPAVLAQMTGMIEEYRQDSLRAPMLALEIPLLYEAGADSMVDRVLVVAAPADVCALRLRERGWDDQRIAAVAAAQMPLEEKVLRADEIVDASGSREETARQVEALWDRVMAAKSRPE